MFDTIQNTWLFAAGSAAALTALIHTFVGGPEVAGPLLRAKDIPNTPKYVNYYCWHLVTITLFAMAIGLIWASVDQTQTGLAWMWTIIAVLFMAWSIALVVWKRQNPFFMPQWAFFAVVSGLAVAGLLG
ncbi:hypothetical protein L0664_03830 [Octadecabacter sp. G9-8]|uniref:DUF423 domain-containing protein n=1 Tax=Octadecabacter dasysiphoniae TaxID=2909341 RepID=A0ABS9CSH6_9RHOB|nr:hypothetical protein [Octadecabacter dasysiphoniae]MCF2870186.1 hypothetical protein [Octadecabacter dasysiphoniae]